MNSRRLLVIAEILLLIVGFISLGWAGFVTARRLADNSWQDYRFEQSVQGSKTSLYGYLKYFLERKKPSRPETEQPTETADAVKRPAPKTRKLKANELIGRIEIPRVKVSAIVREGADTKTLSRAVGHVPYTSLPGREGKCGRSRPSGYLLPWFARRPSGRHHPDCHHGRRLFVRSGQDENRLAEECRGSRPYSGETSHASHLLSI